MGLFKKKGAKITVRSEIVDASNVAGMAGLGEEIMETLKAHGIEPGTSMVVDTSDLPGLNKEIMEKLGQAGVWEQAFGVTMGAPAHQDHDPVAQLERLAELHKKGVLSDYEFAFAKEKLLGQSWNDSAG
jgi:hypothetical protein